MKTVRIKAAAKWSGKLSVPGLHRIVSPTGGEGDMGQGKSLSLSLAPAIVQRLVLHVRRDDDDDVASC